MVSVTLMRSGDWGPDWQPKKDWLEGPGLAGCWGEEREWVQGCLHSLESPERHLAKHTSSPVLTPGPELRMEEMCPGMAPPTPSSVFYFKNCQHVHIQERSPGARVSFQLEV